MTKTIAYVGARTTRERNARGNGLNVYRVPTGGGESQHLQLLPELVNPSFLAFDRTRQFLYAVHGDLSDISAFAIDTNTGLLTPLNRQSTEGKKPVHLAIDPTNRFVVVANHITSTLALLPRNDDGSLGQVLHLANIKGRIGPHRSEQPFAKPHQVEFDPSGRFIIVPDKGLDCVFTYRIDAVARSLVEVAVVAAREGSGPRHVAFHRTGTLAYVINELDSTVTAYRFDATNGTLEPFQIVSSLPDTFIGNSRASEIAVTVDGRFVYASNRGFDSIGAFEIDQITGRLSPVGWSQTNGKTPRFFTLDRNDGELLVANEDSDTIVRFARDAHSGRIDQGGVVARVGSPTCILLR